MINIRGQRMTQISKDEKNLGRKASTFIQHSKTKQQQKKWHYSVLLPSQKTMSSQKLALWHLYQVNPHLLMLLVPGNLCNFLKLPWQTQVKILMISRGLSQHSVTIANTPENKWALEILLHWNSQCSFFFCCDRIGSVFAEITFHANHTKIREKT